VRLLSKDKSSIFSPAVSFKNLFKKPETIKVPEENKKTAKRYRGFHINDLDKCIGCGTCSEICDNKAIEMVELENVKTELGQRNERPKIDYGRCCWCGLCVDICTTGSLQFTQDYTYINHDAESFSYIPDNKNINKVESEIGYERDQYSELLDLYRVEMQELNAESRVQSFMEIVKGFSKKQAEKEASRCVECDICTEACPASMNIPEYIRGIYDGNLEESLQQIYEDNPLPEVCGRICTHNCESICSIGHRGEAVSIRWLKRYAVDNVDLAEYNKILGTEKIHQVDKKVAIIGAGPAGLSAAHYLKLMGYQITIFEAESKAGGMMRYGIPEYRLPYEKLDKDINYIKNLGVEFKFNTRIGENISLSDIKKDYDAVFAATGLHNGRSTRIPGTENNNVYQAIYLLKQITKGKKIPLTKKIVIIGGGNVAMDIARSLARLQKKKYDQINVLVTSLETEDIMPADQEEIEEARAEGVDFEPGRGPKEIIVSENGSISQVCTNCCVSVFDEDMNFNPTFDDQDIQNYDCDMVVEAIGQAGDNSYIDDNYDIEYEGPRIKVNDKQQTSLSWLFAGGDIVRGPDVINGIKTGHNAAQGIDYFLKNNQKSS